MFSLEKKMIFFINKGGNEIFILLKLPIHIWIFGMINSHFLELILRVEDCIVGKREEREREIMSKTYNIPRFHNFSPATKRRGISTFSLQLILNWYRDAFLKSSEKLIWKTKSCRRRQIRERTKGRRKDFVSLRPTSPERQ